MGISSRPLTVVIMLALIVVGLGWIVPERFALMGGVRLAGADLGHRWAGHQATHRCERALTTAFNNEGIVVH
jgi:hypothetical protein